MLRRSRFPSYLRTHRRTWGLTQKELAFLLSRSSASISSYERLDTHPGLEDALAYEVLFDTPVARSCRRSTQRWRDVSEDAPNECSPCSKGSAMRDRRGCGSFCGRRWGGWRGRQALMPPHSASMMTSSLNYPVPRAMNTFALVLGKRTALPQAAGKQIRELRSCPWRSQDFRFCRLCADAASPPASPQ